MLIVIRGLLINSVRPHKKGTLAMHYKKPVLIAVSVVGLVAIVVYIVLQGLVLSTRSVQEEDSPNRLTSRELFELLESSEPNPDLSASQIAKRFVEKLGGRERIMNIEKFLGSGRDTRHKHKFRVGYQNNELVYLTGAGLYFRFDGKDWWCDGKKCTRGFVEAGVVLSFFYPRDALQLEANYNDELTVTTPNALPFSGVKVVEGNGHVIWHCFDKKSGLLVKILRKSAGIGALDSEPSPDFTEMDFEYQLIDEMYFLKVQKATFNSEENGISIWDRVLVNNDPGIEELDELMNMNKESTYAK